MDKRNRKGGNKADRFSVKMRTHKAAGTPFYKNTGIFIQADHRHYRPATSIAYFAGGIMYCPFLGCPKCHERTVVTLLRIGN